MRTLLLGTALLAAILVACGASAGEPTSSAEYTAGVDAGCYETVLRMADHYGFDSYNEGGAISDCAASLSMLTDGGTAVGTVWDGYAESCLAMTLAVTVVALDADVVPVPAAALDEDLIALECVLAADARYGR